MLFYYTYFIAEFTDSLLTSQALIFFLAGFETSSTTMSNALYELALNQHTQDKLREEIRGVYEKDGKLTYDNIKNMKYLDKVVKGDYINLSFTEYFLNNIKL